MGLLLPRSGFGDNEGGGRPSMKTVDELKIELQNMRIDPRSVEETFLRSGGPGGQNVNKVATCVVLRHRESQLVVTSETHRSQAMNRIAAWQRLIDRIKVHRETTEARLRAEREKIRRQKRRRPRAVKERILSEKRHRSEIKKLRAKPG